MATNLAIFLGGGVGALLRNLVYIGVARLGFASWPGTLFVNVVGSLAILGLSHLIKELPESLSSFFRIGLLGGFTTFSTLAFDAFNFFKEGDYFQGSLVIFLNIFFGIVVGVALFK